MLYRVPVHTEPTRVVRGSDGRLYRIAESDDRSQTSESTYGSAKQMKTSRTEESSVSDDSFHDAHDVKVETKPTKTTVTVTKPKRQNSKARRKKVTVIVEDASDSETDDESHSVWRNRVPSPGESWMEPIEA